MDGLDPRLLSVKGIGQATIASLLEGLGRDGLQRALEEKDIGAISSVDRVSGRMAVSLILAYHGSDGDSLLANDGARDIYDRIVGEMVARMHTEHARNRCHLMVPSTGLAGKAQMSRTVHDHSALVHDRERVDALLKSISRPLEKRRSHVPYTLIAEDEFAYARIRAMGLDRTCSVIEACDLESQEKDMVYVYNTRELDESRLQAIACVSCNSKPHEIVPETVLERFRSMRERYRTVSELQDIYGIQGSSKRALEILDDLALMEMNDLGPEGLDVSVESIRSEVEGSLKDSLEAMVLSGKDTLSMLSGEDPPALREIYRVHSRMAQSLVREKLGVNRDLFIMRYPLVVDSEAIDGLARSMEGERSERRFRSKVEASIELTDMEDPLRLEMEWAHDLDLKFGLGCLVLDLDLNPFEVSEGWFGVVDGCHLGLRSGRYQPVSYHLGSVPDAYPGHFPNCGLSSSRISLLTGANSGGKTTLLETIAQVVVMAHMGLPVPAATAFVPELDSLHVYKPKRHMDAGGLESFLKDFLPLCMDAGPRSMLLADELEAMTELEAASRIIRSFLKELEGRGAYSVVVTHLAQEVAGGHGFRIDGIEARGLDEDLNLIVDRTPRICYHARSMPELILKRLHGKARGREKDLYARVLSEFTPPNS